MKRKVGFASFWRVVVGPVDLEDSKKASGRDAEITKDYRGSSLLFAITPEIRLKQAKKIKYYKYSKFPAHLQHWLSYSSISLEKSVSGR